MRWSRGWMGNTSSSTPASIRDRMSRSKNVATRAGYLLVKTASFTLNSPPLRPNVQQDPCGQAVEVNAMAAMRLRPLAQGPVGCHVAGALQLRGPPDTPFTPPVSPKNVTLQPNQTQDFIAVGLTATGDSADVSVTWTATGGSVSGSSSGKLHYGHYQNANCGSFQVVATSNPGNLSDNASVTVTGCTVPVASVSVTPASATISAGQSAQLTATPQDANGNPLSGRTVTWSSSNTSVAVADVNGKVTGVAPGSATITATSEGQSGTAALTVTNVPVASLTVSPASASVGAGQTVQLTATAKDANGKTVSGRVVTWSSSSASVATVTGSGLVTGVTAGSATITATSEGQSGT